MTKRSRAVAAALALAAAALACGSVPTVEEPLRLRQVTAPVAAAMLRDTPQLLIIDLRSREAFDSGHLAGARNIPLSLLPAQLDRLWGNEDRTVLVYCDGSECDRQGMEILYMAGLLGAVLIEGGFPGWQRAGFKIAGLPEAPAAEATDEEPDR